MSFILDALKKSENDRQRATGPAIFEVRVAPPRSRFPMWAIGVGVLLLVNLIVVAWLVLKKPDSGASTAVAAAAAPAQAAVPPVAAPVAPPVSQPMPMPVPPPTLADEQIVPNDPVTNDDDYAPAEEPPVEPYSGPPSVERGSVSGLPTYEKAKQDAGGRFPELRLDMHVFSPKPQDRFVFLNMRKLKEGEALPDGVKVESITNDGAVLTYQGARFTLERE